MNSRDQGLQFRTLCQIWLLREHHKAQNEISFSIVLLVVKTKQEKSGKGKRITDTSDQNKTNKQNQTRQNSEQFQSRVSENNSEERVLTLCRFCSVCKTCVLLQTAVKYIWHFQDHPLNTRNRKKQKQKSFCYPYQEVTKKIFKNPIAVMLGKVRHVQNLAAKNMSSALKSIQGIEFLKCSGMPLHAATLLLSHSGRRGGTTPKKKIAQACWSSFYTGLGSGRCDLKWHRTALQPSESQYVPHMGAYVPFLQLLMLLYLRQHERQRGSVMFYPTSTSAFCRLPSIPWDAWKRMQILVAKQRWFHCLHKVKCELWGWRLMVSKPLWESGILKCWFLFSYKQLSWWHWLDFFLTVWNSTFSSLLINSRTIKDLLCAIFAMSFHL